MVPLILCRAMIPIDKLRFATCRELRVMHFASLRVQRVAFPYTKCLTFIFLQPRRGFAARSFQQRKALLFYPEQFYLEDQGRVGRNAACVAAAVAQLLGDV